MHDKTRKLPGEAAFTLVLTGVSLWLTWEAYGISGFEALSAPGTFPLAVTVVMVVTSAMIAWRTFRLPAAAHIRNWREILPLRIVVMALLIGLYAVALKPVGFLPTSLVFLAVSIWFLGRNSAGYALGISALSVAGVYIIFRLIFSVLMPEGVVPEREIIAWVQHLFAGAAR